jgi:hypothetical protein
MKIFYAIFMSITSEQIKIRHDLLVSVLDEKQYLLYLGAEAKALGWGGVSKVAKLTNSSLNTIATGIEELIQSPVTEPVKDVEEGKKRRRRTRGRCLPVADEVRKRRCGGGRKRATDIDFTLKSDLDALIEPFSTGDSCSPPRWTCKNISAFAYVHKF